jgi:hypothetical protein
MNCEFACLENRRQKRCTAFVSRGMDSEDNSNQTKVEGCLEKYSCLMIFDSNR